MALVSTTLKADLIAIFLTMDSILDGTGDAYQAREMAAKIKVFILTGIVTTSDSGVLGSNNYSGSGTGTMTIDADTLKKDLQTTFEAKYTDDELAAHMATDIDNACKASDTVATKNSSGPGIGKFTGNKTLIESVLKLCFTSMRGMLTGGGNDYYAAQFSTAIESYLKAGTITVSLKAPFASGSGSGGIA